MTTTPVANFLTTTELVEQMFLETDQQTLLTCAQRVCQRWRDIIDASPALQVHLFRKPAQALEGVEPVLNPLLVARFPLFFTRVQKTGGDSDVFYSQVQFQRLPLATNPEPYLREGASWRAMHVRQPPLAGLGVAMPMVRCSRRHFQDVKMGMLYEHVRRVMEGPHQEWRMVWGRIDEFDPAMDLWGGYYEGIRRQLANEVDAVLILQAREAHGDQAIAAQQEREREEDEEGTSSNHADSNNPRSPDRGAVPSPQEAGTETPV